MTYQYVAYVWDHSGEEPVLVEKAKLKNIFTVQDYTEEQEEKGYEVIVLNAESLK